MEYLESGRACPKKQNEICLFTLAKTCFISILISIACIQAMAQVSAVKTGQDKKTTYLLPDGTAFFLEKWDSLEQAWGKGRISLQHNGEDDAKGIVHLVRLTDEMMQQSVNRDNENENALTGLLDKPAPGFTLMDMKGKQLSLRKLRGKIVVLNFWFTSCIPCIREMPELNKLVKAYNSREVVFLGLTFNNTNQVEIFLKKYNFEYTLLPGSRSVDEKYHISSWPTSIVISQKGDVKKVVYPDPNIREKLKTTIDALL